MVTFAYCLKSPFWSVMESGNKTTKCSVGVLVVLFHSVYQDLEAWHGDIQSRLRLIPDPSETLKYKPTCTAIQQLQVR